MSARALLHLVPDRADVWRLAAREETAIGAPNACRTCPLRAGGEWEAGLSAALPELDAADRAHLTRWSCHVRHRPCGGMRRMLRVDADK